MTKIYLAENFLEADQIISKLEANHIFAKKHEIIETSITARMAKPVFEIYVDDKNVEKAVEIIKQMSLSDSSVKSRRDGTPHSRTYHGRCCCSRHLFIYYFVKSNPRILIMKPGVIIMINF